MLDEELITTASLLKPAKESDMGAEFVTGGVIAIDVNVNDYSMTQIAHIVEDNDAKIWSSNVTATAGSLRMTVTLKLNCTDLTSIIQSFQRYGYSVRAFGQNSNRNDDVLRSNYDQLMVYLNV